jgi:uncharacterized membrane protein
MSEHEVFSKRVLKRNFETLAEHEKKIINHILEGTHISRNIVREFDEKLSLGQRLADKMTTFGGSWWFIFLFMFILFLWVALNTLILVQQKRFDPFPFIFLNLMLSMIAALQAPIIMMSQNRHNERDRYNAAQDFEVNLKAELEIQSLRQKIDELMAESAECKSLLVKLLSTKEI